MRDDQDLDAAIEDALAQMDDEQRGHFKMVCGTLLAAYVDDAVHCIVILGKDDEDEFAKVGVERIMAINSTDLHAAQMLAGGMQRVSTLIMLDAPEKGMFH